MVRLKYVNTVQTVNKPIFIIVQFASQPHFLKHHMCAPYEIFAQVEFARSRDERLYQQTVNGISKAYGSIYLSRGRTILASAIAKQSVSSPDCLEMTG